MDLIMKNLPKKKGEGEKSPNILGLNHNYSTHSEFLRHNEGGRRMSIWLVSFRPSMCV